MLPGSPTFEFRAWAPSFPGLPSPENEERQEEIYLIPLGVSGHSIKLRGDALEIKDLLKDQDGLQLWDPATRLPFPIPAALVERELLVRLALSEPLTREHYDAETLLKEVVEPRQRNIATVRVAKRRHLFMATACRAETAEVEVAGQRLMTAAAEHTEATAVRRAVAELGLESHANMDYPTMLGRLLPLPRTT
jgi:hypothetical protein